MLARPSVLSTQQRAEGELRLRCTPWRQKRGGINFAQFCSPLCMSPAPTPTPESCGNQRLSPAAPQCEVGNMASRLAVRRILFLALLLACPTVRSFPWGKPRPEGVSLKYAQTGERKAHPGSAAAAIRAGGFGGNDGRGAYPEQTTWIQDFCRTPGNEFFAEVCALCILWMTFPVGLGFQPLGSWAQMMTEGRAQRVENDTSKLCTPLVRAKHNVEMPPPVVFQRVHVRFHCGT